MSAPADIPDTVASLARQRRDEAYRINVSWLVRLRWAAITGQVVVILVVWLGMHITLPLAPLAALVGVEAASNIGGALWLTRRPVVREAHIGLLVTLDLLLFSGLLYFTGGPSNPFSFLYLIYLALAAHVLRPRWTWGLVALTLACSGALFLDHVPLAMTGPHEMPHGFGLHLKGMWVALCVAAVFIVYFLYRVNRALLEREHELQQARERSAQGQRLVSLATLAAGAAHELASPLSTIAVAAKELEHELSAADAEAREDVTLIREQVGRCRGILDQMASDAGQPTGEPTTELDASTLLAAILQGHDSNRVVVHITPAGQKATLRAPARALAQALRGLLVNALDASPGSAAVELDLDADTERVRLEVRDHGSGMAPDVAARAMEPFFTTKATGRGMGLGLFLAKTVLEQLGGRLSLESSSGQGTVARAELPRA